LNCTMTTVVNLKRSMLFNDMAKSLKKSPNNEIDLDVSTKEKPGRKTTSRY